MVRMGSLGREPAAARAERMALTTVPGWDGRRDHGAHVGQAGHAARGIGDRPGRRRRWCSALVVIPCAITWLRLMT
jgi:hypothetical protein